MTDLMTAVVTGSTAPEVKDLLEAGEEVNARVANGWTALLLAGMHCSDTGVRRVLVDAGADPTRTNNNGNTAGDAPQKNETLANDMACREYLKS